MGEEPATFSAEIDAQPCWFPGLHGRCSRGDAQLVVSRACTPGDGDPAVSRQPEANGRVPGTKKRPNPCGRVRELTADRRLHGCDRHPDDRVAGFIDKHAISAWRA